MGSNYSSLEALNALIEEEMQEGLYLEFKSARIAEKELNQAIRDLTCEVTALANSAGGDLIIGVEENQSDGGPPVAVKIAGLSNKKWNSEWLAAKLEDRIFPKIEKMTIAQVPIDPSSWCLVISVPASSKAPHQADDKKYYARRQFQKMPMAHFEIEDIRNRQRVLRPNIQFGLIIDRTAFVELAVKNAGDFPVFDLEFRFPEASRSAFNLKAPVFSEGISALNPGEELRYYVGGLRDLFAKDILHSDTKIELLFSDESGKRDSRYIVFNMKNHDRSSFVKSDLEILSDEFRKQGRDTTSAIKSVESVLKQTLSPLCGPSGLSISHDTLLRLGQNPNGAKWRLELLSWRGIQEVLNCSTDVAIAVNRHFNTIGGGPRKLEDIEGIDAELMAKILETCELPEEEAQ